LAALIAILGALGSLPIEVKAGDATLSVLAAGRFHDLTLAERRLLEYADNGNEKRGDWAFCGISTNPKDSSNDPKNAATWKHERDIRAAMIRWLAADSKARARVDPKGVRVMGARIVGPLDLSDIHVPFAIALVQCSIPERMDLESTNIPFFDLAGSRIGEIFGPNMIVEGDLDIGYDNNPFGDTWASGEVYLEGAKVGGNASFGAGHFAHSKVEPLGWGAELKRALDLNKSDIKGDLVLCCGFESHGAVILDGAKIGTLYLGGSHLINPNNIALTAANVSVDREVGFIPDPDQGGSPEAYGEVNFVTARIGTNFVVDHARFRGKAGERHGLVAAGLNVGKGFVWRDVTLENGAVLDLRGAVVGGLLDQERSWPSAGKLLIDGFIYKEFGSESPSDATSRLKWLHLQPGFRAQPYQQLANVLRDNGDEAGAARVLAAKNDAQSESSGVSRRSLLEGTANLRRLAEVALSIAIFLTASLIFAQLHYARRAGIAAGENAHRHPSLQMGIETNANDGVGSAAERMAANAPPEGIPRRTTTLQAADRSSGESPDAQNIFRREGEFWTIAHGGITVRLRDAKGLGYIACLLEHPGEEIHVHDLISIVEGISAGQTVGNESASGQSLGAGLEIVRDLGDAGETLDYRARADYHRRLLEVREELGEAQRQNDTGRAETARSELEFLHAELSAAIGRGGHGRKTSAHAERARLLVGKNIRAALDKIQRQDRTLGHYFAASIRTGYFCAYIPAPNSKILWQL
jgi:hypothetical protein